MRISQYRNLIQQQNLEKKSRKNCCKFSEILKGLAIAFFSREFVLMHQQYSRTTFKPDLFTEQNFNVTRQVLGNLYDGFSNYSKPILEKSSKFLDSASSEIKVLDILKRTSLCNFPEERCILKIKTRYLYL